MRLLPGGRFRAQEEVCTIAAISRRDTASSVLVGLWAAVVALSPTTTTKLLGLGLLFLFLLIWWLIGGTGRWISAFLFCAILLPPLPIALGDSGPNIAPMFACFGLIGLIVSRPKVPREHRRLLGLSAVFIGVLIWSECFAVEAAGPSVVILAFIRIALFAIGPLILAQMLCLQKSKSAATTRWLFWIAVAAAVFACADFYFQFPSPVRFGAQFVWLDDQVLRRAQGLFYEASTLGNFCAFFLLLATITCFSSKNERPLRVIEVALGTPALAVALVLSYSRASLLNLFCAIGVFLLLNQKLRKRTFAYGIVAVCCTAGTTRFLMPAYWDSYLARLQASVIYLPSAPDAVLSGRLSTWFALMQFAISHPASLLFGIGYKTLPYSHYFGAQTIADNTYLDLVIETGVLGLATFIALNLEMLRLSWRAARGTSTQAFLARLFFCFWIGELIQMLSGDLITYWRVLPIYFWTLGVALQSQEKATISQPELRVQP